MKQKSSAIDLLDFKSEIVTELRRIRRPWAKKLSELIPEWLLKGNSRATVAVVNRQVYCEWLRAGTRRAIGMLASLPMVSRRSRALIVQRRIEMKGLSFYQLPKVPSIAIIEDELRQMEADEKIPSRLESKHI